MKFGITDFDEMREWIENIPNTNPNVKEARLSIFDCYRYTEDYEAIYQFITGMGGVIE